MSATLRLQRFAAHTAGILCRDGCEVHGNQGRSTARAPALVLLDARSLRGTRHRSREQCQAVGRARVPPWPPPQAVAWPRRVLEGQKGGRTINRGRGLYAPGDS
jgi:hypothetical protein